MINYNLIDKLHIYKNITNHHNELFSMITLGNINDILYYCADKDYFNLLNIILNERINDINELLYIILIYTISYNNINCTKSIQHNFNEYITPMLKNTITLAFLKRHKEIPITFVLNVLKNTDLNSHVVDYILKNVSNIHTIKVLLNEYTKEIKNTDIVRIYLHSSKGNSEIKEIILKKIKQYIKYDTWKVFCKEFNNLSYNDLLLYLYDPLVHKSYNDILDELFDIYN